MAKSAIYTLNSATQALAVGSVISLGSIIRRFGQNINLSGNNINLSGSGYYSIESVVTITGTTAGTVGISIFNNGTEIASSEVSVAVGDVVTIPIQALVREYGCCCNNSSNITFALTGTAETVNAISVIVEKL